MSTNRLECVTAIVTESTRTSVEVRHTRLDNPALEERGYAALNTICNNPKLDLMSYSFHDATHCGSQRAREAPVPRPSPWPLHASSRRP